MCWKSICEASFFIWELRIEAELLCLSGFMQRCISSWLRRPGPRLPPASLAVACFLGWLCHTARCCRSCAGLRACPTPPGTAPPVVVVFHLMVLSTICEWWGFSHRPSSCLLDSANIHWPFRYKPNSLNPAVWDLPVWGTAAVQPGTSESPSSLTSLSPTVGAVTSAFKTYTDSDSHSTPLQLLSWWRPLSHLCHDIGFPPPWPRT